MLVQKKQDARALSADDQESIRLQAVKMVIESRETHREIARLFGVSRVIVSRWVSTYRKGGEVALLKKRRGRPEESIFLKPKQCMMLISLIEEKSPDQLNLPFMVWTYEAVRQLIESTFGLKLSIRSIENYLRRWGFTGNKPLYRAAEKKLLNHLAA